MPLYPYTYSSGPLYCFVILPLSFLTPILATRTHTPPGSPMAHLGRQSAERLALWYPIAADLVLFVANVSHRLSVKKKKKKKLAAGRTL
ncbi:hypothetical protein J3E69DRAFT_332000 [Trichoderma sp. SZMC 28015]